ncbi:MAG: hypothetical protein J0L62_04300 [Bacteroidetes bacterium]|nr:hypothetical protein [Bacteroidota bacterium]
MKVLLLFVGNTKFDSRSQKYLAALSGISAEIIICELSPRISKFPFLLKWPLFLFKAVTYRLFNQFSLLICLDVFSVPGLILFRNKIVFDARELNDRVHSIKDSKLKSNLIGFLEKTGFKKADFVTTVNDYLSDSFKTRYQVNCDILLNLPELTPTLQKESSRKKMGLPSDLFLWVFQGNLQKGRGVEVAFQFIKSRPADEGLLFIGPDLENYQSRLTKTDQSRLFFIGQVPSNEILNYTVAGDAGLMLIETSTESYLNSLPNKFFEYITARLPVLTTPLPQAERFINKYNCGISSNWDNIQTEATRLRIYLSIYRNGCEKLLSEVSGSQQISHLRKKLRHLLK